MSFALKPDYDEVKQRYDAFWHRDVVDRPPVSITFRSDNPVPKPQKEFASYKDWWLDVEFRTEEQVARLQNTIFYADALPIAWPNMGPEIFSAWCGCGYQYGERTTWSEPCITDWDADGDDAVLNMDHELFKLTDRFTDLLMEQGRGQFIVGLTDFHPGGDHVAALRDPERLAVDMIENREWVVRKLKSSADEFKTAYNYYYNKLRAADMPITSWTPLIHDGRYYIPSNDFSCMVSPEMFQEVFLPGIADECRFLDRSIYHLDGPGALRHLDALLSIPELDAVQWIPGAGNEGFTRWIDLYRRIQAAAKGIQIVGIDVSELPLLFDALKPEGVFISGLSGVPDTETADEVLKRLKNWR